MNKEKKMTTYRSTRLVWGLVALLTTGVAQATLLVQESFDYPLVSPINSTQTNGVGFAALSSWGSINANIVAGLGYTGYATAGSGAFQITVDSRIQRSLASSFGGSTFYVSMLINNYGVNGTRFGVELRSAEGPLLGRVINGWGIFAGQNGKAGISNSTGDYKTWTGVTVPSDSLTHLVVFKFDYAANAIKLYVDPLPALGEPAAPSATLATGGDWTINLNSDTWNAISFFRQTGANETLDEVCIGTTWADVAPVNPVATTTDSWWTNVTASAGASWGDANNWVNTAGANALPGPGSAFLTMPGASYTALYDSVQPAISNLTVQNVAPYRTDLIVSAPLTQLGGAAIRLLAGASVTITNNGVWSYEGVNRVTDGNESMFSIRNGGELNVNGGVIAFTNLPVSSASSFLNVGYASTGTLRVTSGLLEYYERVPRAFTNNNRKLWIGRMAGGVGSMEVSGGKVILGMEAGGGETLNIGVGGGGGPVGSPQGRLIVSGGEIACTNNSGWNLIKIGQNYGAGMLIVTNTGSVNMKAGNVSGRMHVGASPYGSGLLRMYGGKINIGDGLTVGYNNGYSGTVWATGVVEVASGILDTGSGINVGYGESGSGGGNGVGIFSLTGGQVNENYWGVFIGRSLSGGVATGRMTVTNGLLNISSSADPEAYGATINNGGYSGLAVGIINSNVTDNRTRAWGELIVSGSAVITNAGVLAIGVNGATGTIVQTGGTIRHVPTGAIARKYSVIGFGYGLSTVFGGGSGTYDLSGGSYYTPNPTYVGGIPTNLMSNSRGGGVGLLKVTGGSFTVNNNTLMVGGYGTGTVTIGSNGVCFAKDIVFTNNTQSTLRCELGTDGLGTLTASSNLVICAGVKLEVDTTAYQGKAVWVKLVDCATRTGSFDPANITVTGQGEVKQDRNNDQDVWLYFRRGTLIGIL